MIQIVMKPTPGEGVVHGETLYTALFNGEDVGLRVRGLRASHAEAKIMVVFREQLRGRTVDYDLEQYLKEKADTKTEEPAPEEGEAHEEPGVRDEEIPQLHALQADDGADAVRPRRREAHVDGRPVRAVRKLEYLVEPGEGGQEGPQVFEGGEA